MLKTLAIVPARAGSNGIPGKNRRNFCGSELWRWAYDIGEQTCDFCVVSSDDPRILHGAGAAALARPSHLAQDRSPMLPVVRHAMESLGDKYDVFVLLQPTSPLRTQEQVREALRILSDDTHMDVDSVVSVVPIPQHYSPDYAVRKAGRWIVRRRPSMARRQQCREYYSRSGDVYAIRRRTIKQGSLYGSHCLPMIVDPNESANIDTEEDWKRAEMLMLRRHAHEKWLRTHTSWNPAELTQQESNVQG